MDHLCFCVLCFSCFCVCSLLPFGHCWERADHLALVGDVNCIYVTFPCGILGMWYLIVSFPDLCSLSYFDIFPKNAHGITQRPTLIVWSRFTLFSISQ